MWFSGDKDLKLPGEAPALSASADTEGRRAVSLVLRPENHMGPVAAAEDRPDTRDSTGLIPAVSSEAKKGSEAAAVYQNTRSSGEITTAVSQEAGEAEAAAAGDWIVELVPDRCALPSHQY